MCVEDPCGRNCSALIVRFISWQTNSELLLSFSRCYAASHIVMADWPQPRKSIVLSVGAIHELVNLRAEVLRSAGYEVISTTSAQKADLHIANGDCDLLLLCHSVSDDWQKRLIRQFRNHCPNGRVVAISNV